MGKFQTKRAGFWPAPLGGLIQGQHRGRLWEVGETVACKSCWGSHNRNFHLLVTPGLLSRHALIGRASLSSRSLQAAWPHKMDADAAVSWSSLVKLSKKLGIVFLLEYNLCPELCLAYIDFYLY